MRVMFWVATVFAVIGLGTARPAAAQDVLLDLSTVEQVAAAIQGAGYKAEIQKADDGTPFVLSAANGQGFSVDLTDCKEGKCKGLSIQSFYKPDPLFTAAFANDWNQANRFLKVSVNPEGELREWFDIDTHGKLTKANFDDLIDWYVTLDALLAKRVDEKQAAAKAKK